MIEPELSGVFAVRRCRSRFSGSRKLNISTTRVAVPRGVKSTKCEKQNKDLSCLLFILLLLLLLQPPSRAIKRDYVRVCFRCLLFVCIYAGTVEVP